MQIGVSELTAAVPTPPLHNQTDTDEPGPVDRWFGVSGGFYFYVTHHLSKDFALIACRAALPGQEKHRWSILEHLIGLPNPLMRRIQWIRSATTTAQKAVSYKDESGIVCEVYRAEAEDEA